MPILTAEQELECLALGFRDVAKYIRETFWKDRRRTSELKRVETYLACAEQIESALYRLRNT